VKTAILSSLLLRRSYNYVQWISILSVCIGSAVCFFTVMYDDEDATKTKGGENNDTDSGVKKYSAAEIFLGIILVLASNSCSVLAGIYFEYVIKGQDKPQTNHNNNDQTTRVDSKISNETDANENEKLLIADTMVEVKNNNDKQLISRRVGKSKDEENVTSIENKGSDASVDVTTKRDECEPEDNGDFKVDKKSENVQPSLWIRNIQLGFFTICIVLVNMLMSEKEEKTPLFEELNPYLIFQILQFAFGGLLVAITIRDADNVQKGLCMGVSVVLTSALSILLDPNNGVSFQFFLGASLAVGGCFIFANPAMIDLRSKKHLMGLIVMISTTIFAAAKDHIMDKSFEEYFQQFYAIPLKV
jgi:drug/metabolite transporter (DMT)-like permease